MNVCCCFSLFRLRKAAKMMANLSEHMVYVLHFWNGVYPLHLFIFGATLICPKPNKKKMKRKQTQNRNWMSYVCNVAWLPWIRNCYNLLLFAVAATWVRYSANYHENTHDFDTEACVAKLFEIHGNAEQSDVESENENKTVLITAN